MKIDRETVLFILFLSVCQVFLLSELKVSALRNHPKNFRNDDDAVVEFTNGTEISALPPPSLIGTPFINEYNPAIRTTKSFALQNHEYVMHHGGLECLDVHLEDCVSNAPASETSSVDVKMVNIVRTSNVALGGTGAVEAILTATNIHRRSSKVEDVTYAKPTTEVVGPIVLVGMVPLHIKHVHAIQDSNDLETFALLINAKSIMEAAPRMPCARKREIQRRVLAKAIIQEMAEHAPRFNTAQKTMEAAIKMQFVLNRRMVYQRVDAENFLKEMAKRAQVQLKVDASKCSFAKSMNFRNLC
ncbi:hypothetical protein IE077_000704 [Cardiosporidium cionae]|uniref:Uncharacterized protein n=1 Tax=Cardiosporidium cionae TaxID=476202 RepID=A0ABQ7J3Y1_9APIC|nr:hypothetical protein IE077_000704 [Cardiosporidium cionae]|eukprot:KAF8817816.1 hypothetical protein IE077_000704 [Cardiosporidium cionae]